MEDQLPDHGDGGLTRSESRSIADTSVYTAPLNYL